MISCAKDDAKTLVSVGLGMRRALALQWSSLSIMNGVDITGITGITDITDIDAVLIQILIQTPMFMQISPHP